MLSLDNAFSFDALRDFDRRVREGSGREEIDTSPNTIDGLSIRSFTRTACSFAGLRAATARRRGRNTQHKNHSLHSAAHGRKRA